MRGQVAEVILREFLQYIHHLFRFRDCFSRIFIRFILIFTAGYLHENSQNRFNRRIKQSEKEESGIYTHLFHKKCIKKCGNLQEKRKQTEHYCRVQDAYTHIFHDMFFLKVSYFVSQHRNKLLGCMIFDQSIEKSDSFVLAKTGEEGVLFSGPSGSVHYINALKREDHLIGIRLDRLTKFTIFQWFKCIEKRHDLGGCDVLYG